MTAPNSGLFEPAVAEAAAAELLRQHAARETFGALQGPWRLDGASAAYQVQDAWVRQAAKARNTHVCGYKVALTTLAMRDMVGYHDSIAGCLLADQIVSSGQTLDTSRFVRLIIEFEIAFRMADDLPVVEQPWTRETIFAHVGCAHPALEIADDRDADYASLAGSILTLAADNAWNQGLAIGGEVRELDPDRLASVRGVAYVDGKEVGHGFGRDVLGHPLDALAWLANHQQTRGAPLRKGDLVTTGSLVKSQFPKAGGSVLFELDGMGDVGLNLA